MTQSHVSLPELRPMGVGDILDTTLRMYRARFGTFVAISLLAYVPYSLLMLLIEMALVSPTPTPLEDARARLVGGLGRILFFIVVWPLVQGALTHAISAAYLGSRLSAGACYRRAAGAVGRLLGTQMLVGFAVMFGFLLLIVPGVIFGLWLMVTPVVVILESLGGTRAMSRSRELMTGNLGKGFRVSLAIGLLNAVVTFAFAFAIMLLSLPHPAFEELLLNLVEAFILPVMTAPIILLYYDLRIRKEAFDLQHLAAAIAEPSPA